MIDMHAQISNVKIEAENEKRIMEKTFDRRVKEVLAITLGNKKDIFKQLRGMDIHKFIENLFIL